MLLLASRARGLAALRVGPVGARRVKTVVALGGAALMASQSESADCAAGQNLRVASYNVLSSKLCEPGYFIKCAKENLDPPTRLKRVQALLEQETKKHAVVCLQEVSREWSGDLHAFFARQGYQFTTGLYGNPFNGCPCPASFLRLETIAAMAWGIRRRLSLMELDAMGASTDGAGSDATRESLTRAIRRRRDSPRRHGCCISLAPGQVRPRHDRLR